MLKVIEVFLEDGNDDHRNGTVCSATWIAVVRLHNGEIRDLPIADEFEVANKAEALSLAQQTLCYL